MPRNIILLHDRVLNFLIKWREKNPGFTFALRKSDFSKKLTMGHWFFGTSETLVLSFWSGMDWKGKVPNIAFCFNTNDNETYIQVSVRDSLEKELAIRRVFGINSQNIAAGEYFLARFTSINQRNFLKNLEQFLRNQKKQIDFLIKQNSSIFKTKQNLRNQIGFISEKEFQINLRRTLKVRINIKSEFLPISLTGIEVEEYGPIKRLAMVDIPKNAQWIFLTGENGSGKTSILRAIAMGLTKGTMKLSPKTFIGGNYKIRLQLNKFGRNPRHIIEKYSKLGNGRAKKLHIISEGFVTLGPARLNIASEDYGSNHNRSLLINNLLRGPHLQIFKTNDYLLDIGTVYKRLQTFRKGIKFNKQKISFITEAITRVCESIVDIQFDKEVRYFENDENKKIFNDQGALFRQLASGYKSLIAMISHMMIHLYYQQPDIDDPSLLRGIVLIDEIDLHFHPKMQKELVTSLTDIFPCLQFIVSTHSPIPLLGAPKGTVIYRVKRNAVNGVLVDKMDDKVAFQNLLPNTLLTSPIFGLNDITPDSHNSKSMLRTEDTYNQVEFNLKLEREINEFINDKREKELIAMFKRKKQ
jgi:hypothetical protein